MHFSAVDHHEVPAEAFHSSDRLLADQTPICSRFLVGIHALGVDSPLALYLEELSAEFSRLGCHRLVTLQAFFSVFLVVGRPALDCNTKQRKMEQEHA